MVRKQLTNGMLGAAILGLGLTPILRPPSHKIMQAQADSFSMMVRVMRGNLPLESPLKPLDLFGNPHKPDENLYCHCWQCPKWDGVEWWAPKPKFQTRPLSRKEWRRS